MAHIFQPLMPECMYDISTGNGFTTINAASHRTSGKFRNVDQRLLGKYLRNSLCAAVEVGGAVNLQVVGIYTIHQIPKTIAPRQHCAILPAVAEIGAVCVLLPSKVEFQYQWNGHGYTWVQA